MDTTLFPGAKRPLIFGHRGFSALAPENTMTSFDLCVEHKIFGVELDVHLCQSGELVIVHDHNLKRVANVDQQVEDLTLDELKALDVGSHKDPKFKGEQIPTLEELFQRHGNKLHYDIEIKEESAKERGLSQKLLSLIQQYKLEKYVLVSSFNPFALRHFKRASHGSIPTATIFSEGEGVPKVLWHGWGRHISHSPLLKPDRKQVDECFMAKFKLSKKYPIICWTVNDEKEGERLLSLGVEGLISDHPTLFT